MQTYCRIIAVIMCIAAAGCATRTYSYERTTTDPVTGIVEHVSLGASISNSDVKVGKILVTIPGDPPITWEVSDLDAQERMSETILRLADTLDKTLERVP